MNWKALGSPPATEEEAPIKLRHPGEKKQLPTVRLDPPPGTPAPRPLLKPAVIPEDKAGRAPAGEETAARPPEKKPAPPAPSEAEKVAEPAAKPRPAATADAGVKTPGKQPEETRARTAARSTRPDAPATTTDEEQPESPAQQAAPEEQTADQLAALGDSARQPVSELEAPGPAFARVMFDEQSTAILSTAREKLQETAERLSRNAERIQLKAYGGPRGDLSSESRKLSLKRALAVYNYLRDEGVLTSRMDVRAFGGARDSGPADRVDIVLQDR